MLSNYVMSKISSVIKLLNTGLSEMLQFIVLPTLKSEHLSKIVLFPPSEPF